MYLYDGLLAGNEYIYYSSAISGRSIAFAPVTENMNLSVTPAFIKIRELSK